MMFNLKDAFFVPSAEYPTQLEWEDFFLIRLYQIAHYTKSPRTGVVRKKIIRLIQASLFYPKIREIARFFMLFEHRSPLVI